MFYEFIELDPFSAIRDDLFGEEEYLAFQWYLMKHPEAGDIIPGTDGCRKIRWGSANRGKRGGIRVIYFLRNAHGQIILVYAYAKNDRVDVPRNFLKNLKGAYDD